MIDDITINRFVLLTPFQQSLTYFYRNITSGAATDIYTQYNLSTSRSRELNKKDVSLNPDLILNIDLVFELWQPILDAAGLPDVKKDDYVTDICGNSWTINHVLNEFHQNLYTLYCIKKV